MDSREGRELPSAGELDEETIARKRSRRVSFAETTAVHFFDRDEDYETPPESRSGTEDGSRGDEAIGGFHGDHSDSDDSKVSARDEDDEDEEQERFIRDIDSLSPGSAVGSVTSNDDDNFFGPVSTSFVRTGSLSDAGMSDDNNQDITLDSTAFSLHFRSIAPPDDLSANSAGSIRTPTGDTVPTDTGHLIFPAGFKKRFVSSKLFDRHPSGTESDSNNMSLVVDKPSRYDYGKLSPTLEKLLDEVDKSLLPNSSNNTGNIGPFNSCSNEVANLKETGAHGTHISTAAAPDDGTHVNSHLSSSSSEEIMINKIDKICPSPIMQVNSPMSNTISGKSQDTDCVPVKAYHEDGDEGVQTDTLVPSEDQLSGKKFKSSTPPQSTKSVPEVVMSNDQHQLLLCTPKGAPSPLQSPLQGSVSSLRAKRQQLFLDPTENSSRKQPTSSLELELMRHGERISAIKKHISKLRIPDTPEYNHSRLARSRKDHLPLEPEGALEKVNDASSTKAGRIPNVTIDNNLVHDMQKISSQGLSFESEDSGLAGASSIRKLQESTELVSEQMKLSDSRYSMNNCSSETIMLRSPVISQDLTEEASTPSGSHQRVKFAETKEDCQDFNTKRGADNQDWHSFGESLPISDDLVGKRRKVEDNLITVENKISRIDRSPEFLNDLVVGASSLSPDCHLELYDKSHVIGEQSSVKAWTDILSKATSLLVSPSILKLSMPALDVLEDVFGELQMARKYMRLSSSLRNNYHLTDLRQQRIAEARSLQDRLLFEKAKFQLKHAKLEKLRNKVQLTQSGVQECNTLKSMFSQLCLRSRTSEIMEHVHQEDHDMVISMRRELKYLEKKVEHLLKSLQVCCKTKGNIDSDDFIEVANEHLKTKNCLRSIHQDLQLWELSDIVKKGDERDILLSYSNLLIQRFTIKSDHAANVFVSHSLNEANIDKTFPNMNACTAFGFVFRVKSDSRVVSLKYFQQKTLETTLLLGTLVEVMEEVQIAAMEIRNLTCSTFYCQPSGQLELHLCFRSFTNGRKVTLILNMSNLNCAIYPSEPSELKYMMCESETTLPSSVFDDIVTSVKTIQGGQLMILRFCQSASKVVQASVS